MGTLDPRQGTAGGKFARMYRDSPPAEFSPKEIRMQILLVDDDPGFRSTLKKVIETRGGFSIREAGDGEEAVQMSREYRPDIILMDLAMPRLNGLEATRIIKEENPESCIVICSVYNESIYFKAAFDHGADAFMQKSMCFSDLDSVEKLVMERQA